MKVKRFWCLLGESNGGRLHIFHRTYSADIDRNNDDRNDFRQTLMSKSSIITPIAAQKQLVTISSSSNMRSTLVFIVPTIAFFSIIPAAMAWKQGDSSVGTTGDSDF